MGLRVVTLKMTRSAIKLIDELAQKHRVSRSELIRAAVVYVIANGLVRDAIQSYPENAKRLGILRDDNTVEVGSGKLVLGGPVFIIDVGSAGDEDEGAGKKDRGSGR